jgi:2-C-methyl-D-erythritol 2,4-cyclodiphosphate synthase
MIKAGIGYDLHRLAWGRKLVIGGVEVESNFGCIAHSDGDVLLHSIIDAILSASCGKDIGTVFSDSDEKNKDRSSLEMLEEVKKNFLGNFKINCIDSVIVLDKPKIVSLIPEMKKNISKVLDVPEENIGIKAKTSEDTKLFTIEAYSIVLIEK